MRLVNSNYAEIDRESIDLTKGEIVPAIVIRDDAEPVDNIKKFAWADDDYEKVEMYVEFKQEYYEPTQEQRIAELEEAIALLLSGVTE